MTLQNVIVGIGGASSSGKSTIAKLLHSLAENSLLVQQDDFYKNDQDIPIDSATGLENWDSPEAINMDAFAQEVNHLRRTGLSDDSVKNIRYSSDTNDQDLSKISQEVISKVKEQLTPLLQGRKLIIVDGFMILHDPKIIQLFDIRIFIKCSYTTLKNRREARSGYVTQETFWVDPPGYFDDIVYPAYADSHKCLFEDGDVEGELKTQLIKDLKIEVILNDDGVPIDSTILKVSEVLQDKLGSL